MKLAGRADTQVRPYGIDVGGGLSEEMNPPGPPYQGGGEGCCRPPIRGNEGVVLMRDFCEGLEH